MTKTLVALIGVLGTLAVVAIVAGRGLERVRPDDGEKFLIDNAVKLTV